MPASIWRRHSVAFRALRSISPVLILAEHAGEVVSIDDLLGQVWTGVIVTPDSVYQAITSLRRLLGDDAKQPTYIATVPRLGYRMVATVSPWVDQSLNSQPVAEPAQGALYPRKNWPLLAAGIAIALLLAVAFLVYGRFGTMHQRTAPNAPPTSSFYFKGKKISIADIAKSLGVA